MVLEKILLRAEEVLKDLVEFQNATNLGPHCLSLVEFYGEIRLEKGRQLFGMVKRVEGKDKSDDLQELRKLDLIQMAAQRVVFRLVFFLVSLYV